MQKKQKSYYKSVILTNFGIIFWIIGFIFAIISETIIDNNILVVICVLVSILGLILLLIDGNLDSILLYRSGILLTLWYKYKFYGVPNNKLNEFKVNANEIYSNQAITIYEQNKGEFKVKLNDKELLFDLRGWHNKSYCLYEYFISVIQVDLSKGIYKKMKKSISTNKCSDLNIEIIFKNGKKKNYAIISNNKSILLKKFKHRLSIKHDCLKIDKLGLKNLYDFNI